MILAIETSCDETAAALVERESGRIVVRSNVVSSQITVHAPYGGVVPDLAAREHAKNIEPVVATALQRGGIPMQEVEAIAVTQGPGLAPALHIGVSAAKTLAYYWKKPLLGIHHIEGHIYANFIDATDTTGLRRIPPSFPLIALIVSGGHTEIVLMKDHFRYEILGETEDDAAGEAFDKVARMLGLPYPGGPEIAQRADISRQSKDETTAMPFSFPRPLIDSNDFRFSFSGLKTSVLYFLKKHEDEMRNPQFINKVCFEFQEAVIETLLEKTRRALSQYHPPSVIIAGGVSANTELRNRMAAMIDGYFPKTTFFVPPPRYSLDNAAMIGTATLFRWEHATEKEKEALQRSWITLTPNPNLPLEN